MSPASKDKPKMQYGALPWRRTKAGVEILLITTLNTRRWIVPKGWPMDGLPPHATAAQEALEEAGISGKISPQPIGSFVYGKGMKDGDMVPCEVRVFPMQVESQLDDWPEKGRREIKWCSIKDALRIIEEPDLRRLIADFAPE